MRDPSLVAIIDGVFDREYAVTTREIRMAIARGVRVVGSSSMGALRAAEVHEMIGVGRIYELYRSGSIQRDDEVAIRLDAATGAALTEPLANVRFAVDGLVRAGTLDPQKGARIIETASALHFSERTYPNILHEAGLAHLEDAGQLIAALRSIDLKREDAQTLLERLLELGADPHWDRGYATRERHDEHRDHFESARVSTTAPADAALFVWEFGEPIQWAELVTFLAVTGKLDLHARRVFARARIDEPTDVHPRGGLQLQSVQELFGATMTEWGWNTPEEVHVTLNDLGIGFDDIQAQLQNERLVRKKLHAVATSQPESFMRAMKIDLLMTDLALKREVMRLGALRVLAQAAPEPASPPTDSELQEAKRALLCERSEMAWEGLLDESGMCEADARPIVELIASARRVGVALLETLEQGRSAAGKARAPMTSWPRAPRATGSASRSIADTEAAAIAQKLGRIIGVTRVAQLGELERFGLHVGAAYRASEWSSTIGSGKGESIERAITGALMEELEKYCQERFTPDTAIDTPFCRLEPASAIDPRQCALPFDSSYSATSPIAWSWADDLVAGEPILVPTALVSMRRVRNDVLYSPRRGAKIFSSNGLASGFTITEALVHALCERIERHAMKLAEQAISNPGHLPERSRWPFTYIDLLRCPDSTQRLLDGIRRAGYEARVMDVTGEVGVPTFSARIFRPAALHGLDEKYAAGACTHPNAEVALNGALLEAVQGRITAISGAREDFGIKARSLGRHERPRPLSRGDAYWIRPYVPKKPLTDVRGKVAPSAREDLEFILQRLTAAGFERVLYWDLSRQETSPAHVVRALVPGMEDTNPFHTGLRARTLMVQDLMRRHGW
ncbi:YcaO-like family protein [Pendulispora albinea]|uniref:YcaO-like family protein n=1 Tax=Pendulispora albinea TaxID=2741071 RepID=A0ABZ2LZB3_9BACT